MANTTKLAHNHPKSQEVIAESTPSTSGGSFDFEVPVIEQKAEVQTPAQVQYQAFAAGSSVVIGAVAALVCWAVTLKLRRLETRQNAQSLGRPISSSWHVLSLLVHLFLAGNVFFGALSAFLLTGNEAELVQDYFLEMSAFKIAKLSHQHFFGYGLLFAVATAAAFLFVGTSKRRVLFPALIGFSFAWLDIASWWLSRFVNIGFHNLSVVSGAMFSLAFLALFAQTVSENLTSLFKKQ